MSKKVILVCDRHDGEHPAVTSIWLKTAGMRRIARLDVCAEAYAAMLGAPLNGQPLLPAPVGPGPKKGEYGLAVPGSNKGGDGRRKGMGAMPGSETAKLAKSVRLYVARTKHRFSLDEAASAIGSNGLKKTTVEHLTSRISSILRAMITDGLVERFGVFGVYGAKGVPAPPKLGTPAEVATAIAKEVRTRPGIRVAYLPNLLDLEPPVVKRTMRKLAEMGLIRTKGQRTASRAYPVTKS